MDAFTLINWPTGDDRYRDTGEGGMFAYAVVTTADVSLKEACTVDVAHYLTRPDVCVSREAELWEPFDYHASGSTRLHNVRARLEQLGEHKFKDSLNRMIGEDELSVPLRAALYLGSTSASLSLADGGGYFEATYGDLTPAGRALCESLSAAYGTSPQIVTFLDT